MSGVLLFEVADADYLDSRYREALATWLRSLVIDFDDVRRIAVYDVWHGYEARIEEYVRDADGRIETCPGEPNTVVTRSRVVPFTVPNWPLREGR